MTFPTIPTVAAGRVLTVNQANTTATRTFPDLSGLTKTPGDLLIAICVVYQSGAAAGALFSSWAGGGLTWTEFADLGGTTANMSLGAAYTRAVTGSETGAVTVTQATVTGHASMILLSIPGAHTTTAPEAAPIVHGTTAAADPAAFDPAGWAAEDTLWIAVGGSGETAITGTWDGMSTAAPANYTDRVDTNTPDSSVVGQAEAAVAFRQLNAASENVGTWTPDLSNARNSGHPDRCPAGGIYSVAQVEVDGDPASTEVKVTLSNSDYFINADVSLLPPGARAALIGWLGCVEAPGSHIRDDRGVCT